MAIPGILKTLGLMTTSEAADTIGIHRNTIWNAIKQNHIRSRKIGNSIALRPKDVAKFRAKYLSGAVTTTSKRPKKKGRPRDSAAVRAAKAKAVKQAKAAKVEAAKLAKADRAEAKAAKAEATKVARAEAREAAKVVKKAAREAAKAEVRKAKGETTGVET